MGLDSKKLKAIMVVTCTLLAAFMMVELGLCIGKIHSEAREIDIFLETEGIVQYTETIPTRDGSHISAYVYLNESSVNLEDHSVPAIIYCPGANSLKSRHFDKHVRLLRTGYAVIAMEQRGHGESGGFFSFYQREPYEISDVMDFIAAEYPQINSTHFGLVGMSLGGGTSVAAQALDERIYASVIYHPLCNLTDFFNRIGVDLFQLSGYLPGMSPPYDLPIQVRDWDPVLNQTMYESSTINLVNETNTKNLLLLHGTEDEEVHPSNSEALESLADPTDSRSDIKLILRDGLGHGQNERNTTSFKYQLAWFNHFFMNDSVDLDNLETEIGFIHLDTLNTPYTGAYKSNIENFVVLLVLFLFILLFFIADPWSVEDVKNKIRDDYFIEGPEEERIMIVRSFIIVSSFLGSGLLCSLFNPSLLYGLFFYPVLISTPLLLVFPLKDVERKRRQVMNPKTFRNYLYGMLIFAVPFLLRLILYNYGGANIIDEVHSPEPLIFLYYIGFFSALLVSPMLLMDGLHFKRIWLIVLVYLVGGLIFVLFVPVPPVELLPVNHLSLLVPILLAGIMLVGFIIIKIVSKLITRNALATLNIIGVVVSVFLLMRVFRLI